MFCRAFSLAMAFCFGPVPMACAQNTLTDADPARAGVTVVLPDDFPPYVSVDSAGEPEGERIDMWALWSRTTGIPVTIIQRPWPDVLATVARKEADVADAIGITPERLIGLDFGPSHGHADVAIFTAKDLPAVNDIASARGQTVGVLENSQCLDRLQSADVETRSFGSSHDLIYAAVIGELPVFCFQTAPAAYLLAQAGIEDTYRASAPIFTTTLHWTVRKGEKILFDRISDGFRLIAPSQTAAIAARWSGQAAPVLGSFRSGAVLRLLAILVVFLAFALSLAAVLRSRLAKALHARSQIEEKLRQRIREQSCLYEVFLATDNMQRATEEILRDVAEALHKGWPGAESPLVRAELMGHIHDEIGSRDASAALTTPIMMEGKERGRITLLLASGSSDDGSGRMLLGLAASRIAGRTLGATALVMLKKSEERFRRTFQHSAQATAIIQEGRFVNANRAALDLLGYRGDETFLGLTPGEISPRFQPDGEVSAQKAPRMTDDLMRGGASRFEWEHLKRNGESVLVEVLLTAVAEDGRTDIFVLWNDITVKRQAEAALAAYQQTLEAQVAKRTQELTNLYDELQAIFATAKAGIALVRDGCIVTCNPSLASLLLWPHNELIGRTTRAFFYNDAASEDSRIAAYKAMDNGEVYEATTELVRLDGSKVWVRIRATAVEPQNPAKGTVWVLEDISNEYAARCQLAEARDLAVQAARLKSEFLAHMSHELRSPINAVLGFTELLSGTDLAEHQRNFVQKVQASGRHLLLILNDVLDLSKVEAGKLRIEHCQFALPSVLRNAVDTVSKGVADKNIELLVEMDPAVPRTLIGDPLRISQILMNYLSNALKFTPAGTIRLAITPEPAIAGDQPDTCRLRFSVADSGVGMTQEQVARMFQSFSQAEDSTARLYGGTGLGLSISRQLATLMGGEVGVSSVEGNGSTFWAVLPLRSVASVPAEPEPDRRLAGRRILLIDDHPGALGQTAAALGESGANVICAASGSEALAAVAQADADLPDAVVVDLKMPGMNGIAAIRNLREKLGEAMPPAILMTKQGGQETVQLTLAEGIEDLVIKPVDFDALVDKLSVMLKTGAARLSGRHLDTRVSIRRARPGSGPKQSLGKRALVVDDNPINRDLTAAMLGKHGLSVETAENGADGLERLLDQHFDVVFMDNQMPVMGGLEATRRIRALPTEKGQIPIIGLTGRATAEDHQEGIDAGMNDYLVKPVTPEALHEVLARWLLLGVPDPTE
ncbi:hypothetical protein HYN69_11685 [Gemmobacter aquarius]|uniref:histidine kinase n=2 Tax=Paragemmobacter aquarius TaxID=2169400 RepID=A0A2S0UMP4_9RHOB|nr:hypothetical protein HYN69_11685 [Gemmobacter aquarius]